MSASDRLLVVGVCCCVHELCVFGLLRCWVSGMACVVVPVGMLSCVTDRGGWLCVGGVRVV